MSYFVDVEKINGASPAEMSKEIWDTGVVLGMFSTPDRCVWRVEIRENISLEEAIKLINSLQIVRVRE